MPPTARAPAEAACGEGYPKGGKGSRGGRREKSPEAKGLKAGSQAAAIAVASLKAGEKAGGAEKGLSGGCAGWKPPEGAGDKPKRGGLKSGGLVRRKGAKGLGRGACGHDRGAAVTPEAPDPSGRDELCKDVCKAAGDAPKKKHRGQLNQYPTSRK